MIYTFFTILIFISSSYAAELRCSIVIPPQLGATRMVITFGPEGAPTISFSSRFSEASTSISPPASPLPALPPKLRPSEIRLLKNFPLLRDVYINGIMNFANHSVIPLAIWRDFIVVNQFFDPAFIAYLRTPAFKEIVDGHPSIILSHLRERFSLRS